MERDQQFAAFVAAYPASRRQRGYMVETLFLAALEKVSYDVLIASLAQHTRSEQWQNGRLIPNMKVWLEEERWIQVLPEPQPARLSVADEARRFASLSPQDQLRRLGVKR
jgi:hypothetical protein